MERERDELREDLIEKNQRIEELHSLIDRERGIAEHERALADRLANALSIALSASNDPNAAYAAWEEARK